MISTSNLSHLYPFLSIPATIYWSYCLFALVFERRYVLAQIICIRERRRDRMIEEIK